MYFSSQFLKKLLDTSRNVLDKSRDQKYSGPQGIAKSKNNVSIDHCIN